MADGLTKDVGESADGLRAVILFSQYTIADEKESLQRRAAAKDDMTEFLRIRAKAVEKVGEMPYKAKQTGRRNI